jgi:hypothetical protein
MHVMPGTPQRHAEIAAAVRTSIAACMLAWFGPIAAWGGEAAVELASRREPTVSFARDVQPILASRCIQCHGPQTTEAGLRLDDRAIAVSVLESGHRAIVPGQAHASELVRRISADESERMPPEGEPLSSQQIAVLRRWISTGADWPDHWAYQPLEAPSPPDFDDAQSQSWIRTPIDRFILNSLRERGLSPASPADRRTLLRRVYFDLIGLPPLPEEAAAYLSDESPDAYEKLVDRLLASPQYGERWARHWMDVVHYADSHGFEHDLPRSIWRYRDYLINAFNNDKPYAEFIREQIAGDAIAPDDPDALTATGFLAAGPWDQSTLQSGQMDTADYRLAQYLDRDDILSTVMTAFVSSTVHCARCHDHKFDPISQADYYALQSVFAGIDKATRQFDPDPAVGRQRKELLARRGTVQQRLAARDPELLSAELQSAVADWEEKRLMSGSDWHVLEPIESRSANGAELVKQPDMSLLSIGNRPDKDVYTVVVHPQLEKITAVRVEILADASLPEGGPGRQDNGNMHLNELVLKVSPRNAPEAAEEVPLSNPRADFNQTPGWPIEDSLDGVQETSWGIYPEVGRSHCALFDIHPPVGTEGPVTLTFELHQSQGRGHLIGRFRLAVTDHPLPLPVEKMALPAPISAALAASREQRTDDQKMLLAGFYLERQVEEELAELPEEESLYCGTNQFEASGSFHPADKPRPVYLLERGEIDRPGVLAHPGTLRFIPGLTGELKIADPENEAMRRIALADWLANEKNVLTWRSIANRVWHYHFGQGLVATPNDFGRMGSPPTHPELLDWLATTLRDNGGSLKALHRLIVTSAAYRQSSRSSTEAAQIDAGNHFLWRMNRRRLDCEAVRDATLRISGKLNLEMGGPPVKHFLEVKAAGSRPEADYQHFDVDEPANNRRSVYRYILRTMPDPFMSALDCPDGNQPAPTRTVSITALQALAMVNDKFVIRQSEHIAERLASQKQDIPTQIKQLYLLMLGREPRREELTAVTNYAEQFGLANACRFLLNTNEFMFVD